MGCSPDWGWLLAEEAAVTWWLPECWVDIDTSWMLILCARFALHQSLTVVVVVSAWATDAYLWLLLLLNLLLLGSLLLLRSLINRLLYLRL